MRLGDDLQGDMPTNALTHFGTTVGGADVRACRLDSDGMTLEVIEYGAALRSLRVAGRETVLGFGALSDYEKDRSYQGVVVGRVANRIGGSTFALDGIRHQVPANEGPNCLHGGVVGFGKRLWRFLDLGRDWAMLAYASPDGEDGFPGAIDARVTFRLSPDALEISWEATTDRPTPLNLTQHPYFNLGGDPTRDVLNHTISVRADAMTPVGRDLIPTGAIVPVAGTPFDLRSPKRLGDIAFADHLQIEAAGGCDHNWVLSPGVGPAVTLRSPETGLTLEIETDQPGVQVYAGQGLSSPFVAFGGVAIEPQNFPDAMNQPGFPDAILRPGTPYSRRARYRFRTDAGT